MSEIHEYYMGQRCPERGDYIQLLDASGMPSENHTSVARWTGYGGMGLFLVEDDAGESFAVTRLPEFDTDTCRAWQEVITGTA